MLRDKLCVSFILLQFTITDIYLIIFLELLMQSRGNTAIHVQQIACMKDKQPAARSSLESFFSLLCGTFQ